MTDPFIHPHALCEAESIGPGTRIWAFAHVLKGSRIGRDCNVCDHVFIENDVIVGDAVTIKCGVQLWNGVRVGHRVFIGPNATFANDRFPRSKAYLETPIGTVVEDGASVGANATILPGVRIGYEAMIGAGAVVLNDVPPRAIVVGNPARVVGYANAVELASEQGFPTDFPCRLIELTSFSEKRGRLFVADESLLPFSAVRMFLVDRVPGGDSRGSHAHRDCHQLLICTTGSQTCVVDDGFRAYSVVLNSPLRGLYVPPGIWGMQFAHSPDACLLVLASAPYEKADYLNYAQFTALVSAR